MENSQPLLSLLIITITSILLVITGLKKQPGIGVIGAVIVIALTLFFREEGLDTIGFSRPASCLLNIFGGLVLGIVIQFITIIFIEPFSEKITKPSCCLLWLPPGSPGNLHSEQFWMDKSLNPDLIYLPLTLK